MCRIYYIVLLFLSCSIHAIAQTDFYYYNGEKIPLTLNDNKVIVSIPKECSEVCERIRENVQVLFTIDDEVFDILVTSITDLEKLGSLDFWKEDAGSVIITSSYFTEDNKEVFATPYLNVKLIRGQDIDLLSSYAEENSLRIVKSMPSMPLWYILSLTLDSKKNTLECANELFESGKFAASVPDLADFYDETTIRNITQKKKKENLAIFNLSGRKMGNGKWLNGKLQKGIYIQDGRKITIK